MLFKPLNNNTLNKVFLNSKILNSVLTVWKYKAEGGHVLNVSIGNGKLKYPIGKSIFTVNLPLKLSPSTVANADIWSLKSLHTLFDKFLDHMLVKILSFLTKNRVFKKHFWQSVDAVLEDVRVAETIV